MRPLKTLGVRVAYARGLAKFTQRGLSAASGLDPSHIRLIEDGDRREPKGVTIAKIAEALGVSITWLLTGNGDAPTADTVRPPQRRQG